MTVTMQDVGMILGLLLKGLAVTGIVQSKGWSDMVENIIGLRPPALPEGFRVRLQVLIWWRDMLVYGYGTCLEASFSWMGRET
jgi:hypothetical protein